MTEKADINADNVDLARFAFGAYQSYGDKPVRVEHTRYGEGAGEWAGKPLELLFGQVNPCRHGDQCEGHSCYCNHPDGPRKCRQSWYTGGEERDQDCPWYEANPYWQEVESGDFYEGRGRTLAFMRERGLVDDDFGEEVKA